MTKEEMERKKREVIERIGPLGYSNLEQLKSEMEFKAFFLFSDAIQLELNLQVISDLVCSKDGRIGGANQRRSQDEMQAVDIYISNPDLEFADKYERPRHGQGIIIHALRPVFKHNYPHLAPFTLHRYGKPEKNTFDFAKNRLREKAES
jgi:ribonucleotide monophosphatase NagD (HAD superfamily)